ncbi:MAG: MFS transporter, partial [Nocardioides sp.]|uniref:MFS transporter n=1 Tax=Nocardioides sp. TaxID=35761 RepID=UPI0039E582C2
MTPAARRNAAVWAASAALSALGDTMTFFALAWAASSHGPGAASLVLTIGSAPLCLLILVGGLVADRCGVRAVMVCCDLAMAAVMGAFAVGALWSAPVWALAVVSFASGAAAGVRRPAAGVFPRLFARDDELTRLMATMTLLTQVAQMTGPVLGGVLLDLGGLPCTSGIDAVSFALVGLVLIAVRPPLTPSVERATVGWASRLREAVAAARTRRGVTPTLIAVFGLAVTILPLVELCVPLAGHAHGWGAGRTGLVGAAWPVGGIAVVTVVRRRG